MIVTTFSKSGYDLYGKNLLESLIENYQGNILCYYDEEPIKHERISYKSLSKVFGHDQFIEYCKRSPIFQGKIGKSYSYTFDAVRFCHKVFAQLDAFQHGGKIYWVDGDSILEKPISEEFLTSLFNDRTLAILSRPEFYTETGFIGFDTHGEKFKEFLTAYTNMYRKGLIFTLPGWHDCYALDSAINQSEVPYNDLVGNWKFGDKLEVLEDTVLGPYLTHNKGGKKFARTRNDDKGTQSPLSLEPSRGLLSELPRVN